MKEVVINITDPRLRNEIFDLIKELGIEVDTNDPIQAINQAFFESNNFSALYDWFEPCLMKLLLDRGYTFLVLRQFRNESVTIYENELRKNIDLLELQKYLDYEKQHALDMLRILNTEYSLEISMYEN